MATASLGRAHVSRSTVDRLRACWRVLGSLVLMVAAVFAAIAHDEEADELAEQAADLFSGERP